MGNTSSNIILINIELLSVCFDIEKVHFILKHNIVCSTICINLRRYAINVMLMWLQGGDTLCIPNYTRG